MSALDLRGSALERMTTPVWIYDIDRSRIFWANAAALRVWKAADLGELRSRDFGTDMSVSIWTKLHQYQRDFERSDTVFSEVWTHYPQGEPYTMRVTYSGIRLPDGRMAMLCEGGGEYKETPDKVRSAEALVHTSVMITLYGDTGAVLYCNPSAGTMAPSRDAAFGTRFETHSDFDRIMSQLRGTGEAHSVAYVRTSRGPRWHEITARACVDPATGAPAYLVSEVDVTELKTTEAQALYDANHDILTGLPNRVFVQTAFEHRLREIEALSGSAALLFIDLDRFKNVNDSLGHTVGDQLLMQIARRLKRIFPSSDDIARLGGDEFLALFEIEPGQRQQIDEVVQRIVEDLLAPVRLGEHEFRVTASIGISIFPDHGQDIPALMKSADTAMYDAKQAGRNRASYFNVGMNLRAVSHMKLEIDLRRDFENRVLQLYYQPRVSVATGEIVSAEVLLRWPHPVEGFISPDIFIPLAEESELISHIGAWVFEAAARQQAAWSAEGWDIGLSINLSPRQFASGDLVEIARNVLDRTKADGRKIELEITERLLLEDNADVSQTLRDLKALGFGIAIDDFGTGYSNLAKLQNYQIDCLKIDRSFLVKLRNASPITDLIINMCKLLKVKIVAEGVETEAQLAWLNSRGCDEYQGYLYSRPVPAAQFVRLLEADGKAGKSSAGESVSHQPAEEAPIALTRTA